MGSYGWIADFDLHDWNHQAGKCDQSLAYRNRFSSVRSLPYRIHKVSVEGDAEPSAGSINRDDSGRAINYQTASFS
jgi:hypothetical protein